MLELCVVLGIIAILAVLALPVYSTLRAHAQRAQCAANLKRLAVGANLSLQENNDIWPQIKSEQLAESHAEAWNAMLAPFGVTRKTWICPTIQNSLGNPDYFTAENARIDYFATNFDDKPGSSHQWPRQPWFIETGDVHGNGNLILFTDSSISDLNTVVQSAGK